MLSQFGLPRFSFALATLGLLLLGTACTRNANTEKVRLVIPYGSTSSSSSLAAGDTLKMAIVNIQVPGRPTPIVQEFDFESNPVPWGTPLDLVVNAVPAGQGYVIQFLGIFETSAGASMLITYGDATADVGVGTTTINIQATPAGTATREGNVSGRFFTNASSGPTGTLVAYYNPPNGKPRMAVNKSSIVAGWFNVFVLDNIPMTHEVVESGTAIFSALTIGAPALTTGVQVVKMQTPSAYRKDQRNNVVEVRQIVARDQYLGFFKNSDSSITLSSYSVCYASNIQEGLVGLYGAYNGATGKLSQPVLYNSVAGTASDMRPIGGGSAVATYSQYSTETSCNPSSGNQLNFYHHRVNRDEAGYSGIKPPFRLIDPYANYGGYLRQVYDSGTNSIKLEWNYLYGAGPGSGAVDGLDILTLYSTSGGSSGGKDDDCARYLSQGYQVTGSLTTGVTSYSFTSGSLSSNNYWGHQFALCTFKLASDGTKKYVGSPAHSECNGSGCGDYSHFGWGSQAGSVTLATNVESAFSIHRSRVNSVDATTSNLYTLAYIDPSSYNYGSMDSNGEVMFTVMAEGGSSVCGTFNGQQISPGMTAFARILAAMPNVLTIPKGTFVDGLSNAGVSGAVTLGNFCYVAATKVPHFTDLNIQNYLYVGGFSYLNSDAGGILAFRVSGDLSIAAGVTISAAGAGFGGGSGGYFGSGHRKPTDSSGYVSGSNGGAVSMGLGGGGGSPVAYGGDGISSIGSPIGNLGGAAIQSGAGGGGNILFGLGGGGGYDGGSGGGIVFVSARNLIAAPASLISAKGYNQQSTAGGGGGGGSVILVADRAVGSLGVSTQGGDSSATYGGGGSGGAGAGGYVAKILCSSGALTIAGQSTMVSPGVGSVPANASGGAYNGQVYDANSSGWNPACSN